jgi:hypothetical protein
MRRKPLRTVMLAGTLFAAGGVLLHQLLLGSSLALTYRAPATGAILPSIRQWIQLTLAHTSPAHLVEGVGVAWFIFVLALLLLSRTDRAGPLDRESLVRVSPDDEYDAQKANTAVLADSLQAGSTLPRRSLINPAVPHITAPPGLPSLHRSLLELPYAADDNVPTDSAEVSQVNCNPPGLNNGHLLELTRIAATERRCMPCGLFVVAQCVGSTSNSGEAGRRTVDVIVSQVAPLLAHDMALANEHLSALFEMAALRATNVLRHNGIRMAADVKVLVAGIMVIGNDIYVVNLGH